MELRYCRHSCDALATQLGKLLAIGCVNIDKAIHIADAEALNGVAGLGLPLSSQSGVWVLAPGLKLERN